MLEKIPFRLLNFLGFAGCLLSLAFAYFYLQGHLGLAPCPLCVAQRVAFLAAAVFMLLAVLHNPKSWGGRLYGFFILLASAAGAALAGRQVWLQSLPADEVPACAGDLGYIFQGYQDGYFPFSEVISTFLNGSGDCAEVQWLFLGLSIPAWSLIVFIILGLWGCMQMGMQMIVKPSAKTRP